MSKRPPDHEAPAGYRWEAVPDSDWSVLPPAAGKRCRRLLRDYAPCNAPAAAVLMRRNGAAFASRPRWNYCAGHMYGRWVEGDKVMLWCLVPADASERADGAA
jgi:hypothetical protein